MTPTNPQQVYQLKNLRESTNSIEDAMKIGLALGFAAGSAMAAATIAQETVRHVAAAPKKSKSDHRHISKAKLICRRDLDTAQKQRVEKQGKARKQKERKGAARPPGYSRKATPSTGQENEPQVLALPPHASIASSISCGPSIPTTSQINPHIPIG